MTHYIFPKNIGDNLELEPTKMGLKVTINKSSTYIDFEKLKEFVDAYQKKLEKK